MNATDNVEVASAGSEELGVLRLVNRVLERWKQFGATVIGVGAASMGILLLLPANYTADASFVPQGASTSGLSGLAAQFGVGVDVGSESESPDFYTDLLRSRTILESAVRYQYAFHTRDSSVSSDLIAFYDVRDKSEALRVQKAAKELRDNLVVTPNRRTSVVRLLVTTRNPELSQQVAQHLVDLVSDFNLTKRQTRAGVERRFLEGRVTDSRTELRAAEDALQTFMQRNRQYRSSPELTFEAERLTRDLEQRQGVYDGLVQSFDQARLEEVRNTPVITMVDQPQVPPRRDSKGAVGLSLALSVSAGLAFLLWVFVGDLANHAAARGDQELLHLKERLGRFASWIPGL